MIKKALYFNSILLKWKESIIYVKKELYNFKTSFESFEKSMLQVKGFCTFYVTLCLDHH